MNNVIDNIEDVETDSYKKQFLHDMFRAIEDRVVERTNGNQKNGKHRRIRNAFDGAGKGRLTQSWGYGFTSGDTEIYAGNKFLRAHARERARNDDYAVKFLRMSTVNILGGKGITHQSKAKLIAGTLDKVANTMLEAGFKDWGKRKNSPDVTGKLSWLGIKKAIIKTTARDGEIFVREVRGFPNKYRYALQLFEADHIDESYNIMLPDGNEIRMGVELNEWKRPVAYWFLVRHPGDYSFSSNKPRFKRMRIPAEEIIHVFDPDRVNDTRGFTWMHTAMYGMRNLGGYEEAEVISARIAASKMGSYETVDGYPAEGEEVDGEFLTTVEPGALPITPEGYKLNPIDWNHPAGNFPPFVKQCLRRIASGLGVAYNSLASDLEKVNYSSIRAGTLEERDFWKERQEWFIEDFCDPVYSGWLEMFLLLPASNPYTVLDFERLNAPKWIPRTWDWVDPLKDMKANIEGIKSGLMTRTEISAERGKDFAEHIEILKEEKRMLEEAGLIFDLNKSNVNSSEYTNLIDDDENNNDDDDDKPVPAQAGNNGNNGNNEKNRGRG